MKKDHSSFLTIAELQKKYEISKINEIINNNKKMIHSIINRYEFLNVDKHSLMSEAIIGLLVAAGKYNESLSVKFSTYAYYWIKAKVLRFIANYDSEYTKNIDHEGSAEISLDEPLSYLKNKKYRTMNIEQERLMPSRSVPMEERKRIHEFKVMLNAALLILSKKEYKVIKKRWIREPKATLSDLSMEMKLSMESVRQIEKKAFIKMKNYIEKEFMK